MNSGRILVVDDEPQIRRVLRATLTTHGYEVSDARSGEAALEIVREQRFDLVLLDMNMPGVDGIETCRELRQGSEVAIIMLTVRGSERDKVEALDAGADDYVTKPFSTTELLARIRAALRRVPSSSESGADSVQLGDVEINLATRRLISQGKRTSADPQGIRSAEVFPGESEYSNSTWQAAASRLGPRLRRRDRVLARFRKSSAQKDRARSFQAAVLGDGAVVGYRFELPEGR
jgi:two-component system KDP operon response regulator KdpE